jgi:DNA-binding transcriptional regulator YiaG
MQSLKFQSGGARTKGVSVVLLWLQARVAYNGDDCLVWPFSTVRGYGNLKYRDKITYAHRVMCELRHGPPPSPTHQAAHSCGRGDHGCVNPRHLSWATPSQNQLDKRLHGSSHRAGTGYKLTPQDVAAIRATKGKTQDELAKMYGVSRRNIGAVLSGRSWPTGGYSPRGFQVTPYRRKRP